MFLWFWINQDVHGASQRDHLCMSALQTSLRRFEPLIKDLAGEDICIDDRALALFRAIVALRKAYFWCNCGIGWWAFLDLVRCHDEKTELLEMC